jgi:hypothetical protein
MMASAILLPQLLFSPSHSRAIVTPAVVLLAFYLSLQRLLMQVWIFHTIELPRKLLKSYHPQIQRALLVRFYLVSCRIRNTA